MIIFSITAADYDHYSSVYNHSTASDDDGDDTFHYGCDSHMHTPLAYNGASIR